MSRCISLQSMARWTTERTVRYALDLTLAEKGAVNGAFGSIVCVHMVFGSY